VEFVMAIKTTTEITFLTSIITCSLVTIRRWFTIWWRKTTGIVSIDKLWKESKSGNICIATSCSCITIQIEKEI
jgi:hypothetical protein